MTVRTAGNFVGGRGGSKASQAQTAPAAVGEGALRSARKEQGWGRTEAGGGGGGGGEGGGVRGADDGEGNAVVVDAEVMRCAGSGRYALTYADVC